MKPAKELVMISKGKFNEDLKKRVDNLLDRVTIFAFQGNNRVQTAVSSVDTGKYVEKKLFVIGVHRFDRQPGDRMRKQFKAGHGGRNTWEGHFMELALDTFPAALDENDPNYFDEPMATAA